MAKIKVHPSITSVRVLEAVERHGSTLDNPGFCLACGEDTEGVEPDARHYVCDICDSPSVFGAEEVLIGGYYHQEKSK